MYRQSSTICHMHVYTTRVTFYGKEGVESIKVVGCGLKREREQLPVTPPRWTVKVYSKIVHVNLLHPSKIKLSCNFVFEGCRRFACIYLRRQRTKTTTTVLMCLRLRRPHACRRSLMCLCRRLCRSRRLLTLWTLGANGCGTRDSGSKGCACRTLRFIRRRIRCRLQFLFRLRSLLQLLSPLQLSLRWCRMHGTAVSRNRNYHHPT